MMRSSSMQFPNKKEPRSFDYTTPLQKLQSIRWVWDMLPPTVESKIRCVVPIGCMFNLFQALREIPKEKTTKQLCQVCSCFMSVLFEVDVPLNLWICPFCRKKNQLSLEDGGGFFQNLRGYTRFGQAGMISSSEETYKGFPVFLFLVDLFLDPVEMEEVQKTILDLVGTFPEDSIMGLIGIGQHIEIHEIIQRVSPRTLVLRGDIEYKEEYLERLVKDPYWTPNYSGSNTNSNLSNNPVLPSNFFSNKESFSIILNELVEDNRVGKYQLPDTSRAPRCTGAALSFAIKILKIISMERAARTVLFTGGACVEGPGKITGSDLSETFRSYSDLEKKKSSRSLTALSYYESVASLAFKNDCGIDIFAGSLDQIGYYEMKSCVEQTGGIFIQVESFRHPMFKESFEKAFWYRNEFGDREMIFQCSVKISSSPGLDIVGVLGPGGNTKVTTNWLFPNRKTRTRTVKDWRIPVLSPTLTLGIYLEPDQDSRRKNLQGKAGCIQINTNFQCTNGKSKNFVVTIVKPWAPPKDLIQLSRSFDQETAISLVARAAISKIGKEHISDVLCWLDKILIRLCLRFAVNLEKDRKKEKLVWKKSHLLFIQFISDFRNSQFLEALNISPDEIASYRSLLNRENVGNIIRMVQPVLGSYSLDSHSTPSPLKIGSVRSEKILLLDSFFWVIVFLGDSVSQWSKEPLGAVSGYNKFKELLRAPGLDVEHILEHRFPYPRFIESHQYGSQARFLLAKLKL